MARNPKDVIVSYYFHHKLIKLHGFTGTLEEFAQFFMDDEGNERNVKLNELTIKAFLSKHLFLVYNAPFFTHILEAWSKREHPNMHFMFFEDMKKVSGQFL